MKELEEMIHEGAMAFLKKEYSILIIFIAAVFLLLGLVLGEWKTSIAFVTGAFLSMLAGFSGMTAATRGNSRTAQAATESGQARALNVSYFSGSVMGLAVAGLGLLGLGFWFWYHGGDPATAKYINGFAMGASSIALFARVAGGVYTKAADVGADLVGKVEAGIPEDDPRNPGVIADNVGDNVGDIAGMGADIFESFVGSVIATIAIAATLTITPEFIAKFPVLKGIEPKDIKLMYMAMPILIVMAGMLTYRCHYQLPRHALGRFLGRGFRAPLRNCHRSSRGILHFRTTCPAYSRTDKNRSRYGYYCRPGRGHAVHVSPHPGYLRGHIRRFSDCRDLRHRSFSRGYAGNRGRDHDRGCLRAYCR
jgi:hypothetical protein